MRVDRIGYAIVGSALLISGLRVLGLVRRGLGGSRL
jgi:hypothetical protein